MDFHLNLSTEPVTRAHSSTPICLEPAASVREAFHRMKQHRTGAVLVCRDGILVGIFTERDALRMMAARAELDEPLEKHMVSPPVTVLESETVGKAIAKMSYGGYRRLPIVNEEGQPLTILKTSGILHYLVQHFPNVVYTLPPAPHHATQTREGA